MLYFIFLLTLFDQSRDRPSTSSPRLTPVSLVTLTSVVPTSVYSLFVTRYSSATPNELTNPKTGEPLTKSGLHLISRTPGISKENLHSDIKMFETKYLYNNTLHIEERF